MERLNQDANADKTNDPTANYRKYTKGPNFLLIVILSCVVFLVMMAAALFLLKSKATKLDPHAPTPTPNSMIQSISPRPYLG